MPVSIFIRSTAKDAFTAPLPSGVTLPVSAVVFASKLPPIVSGQFTVTCAVVTCNASSARAAVGNSAAATSTAVNRQFVRTFVMSVPPRKITVRSEEGQLVCHDRTITMLVRVDHAHKTSIAQAVEAIAIHETRSRASVVAAADR